MTALRIVILLSQSNLILYAARRGHTVDWLVVACGAGIIGLTAALLEKS